MDADELAEYVRALVDTMPPLTDEQRATVSTLLRAPAEIDNAA